MVAPNANISDRFAPPPKPFLEGRWHVPRLTRADAEAMVRIGVIPEDASTELLNGMIVLTDRSACEQDVTMIGQDHRVCVERFSALRSRIDSPTRHVESQQPLVCSDTHVPQPDFMVLRGVLADYSDLPAAADAFCVVEVADSSYERDAGDKLAGYARAGIEQYIIVNLRNQTAEIYTNPDTTAASYQSCVIVSVADQLPLRVGRDDHFEVLLSEVLP